MQRRSPSPAIAIRPSLLTLQPQLGQALDSARRRQAKQSLDVALESIERGSWEPVSSEPDPGHLGYLVVEGLLSRQVSVGEARSIELLTDGDLLRPWQEDAASFTRTRWIALEPTRLAVLDRRFTERVSRYPELVAALVERAVQRSRNLAVHCAITNAVGLERRLMMLFWQLAERWGNVASDGVVVPLRLTHQAISDLVGARRPSVTSALVALAGDGRLVRSADGSWLLRGEPPMQRSAEIG